MQIKNIRPVLWGMCLVWSLSAQGAIRHYSAKVESSAWQVATQNRLQCTLEHQLPGYGKAMFTSMASKQLNMEFELDMLRLPKSYGVAAVLAVPPKWMPGQVQRDIAQMPIRKQYNGDLPEQAAWTMLTELEKGFWPTIFYQDWYNPYDKITVGLNASNFATPYLEFAECVSNLLPYSFEDIAYTILSYNSNSVDLTNYSKKRLAMIGEYLKEDQELELVLLDGYSDSRGGRWTNHQLSVNRAVEIKQYFSQLGVAPNRIQITGHGERRHIAPNAHPQGRAKNRRVIVKMSKT